MLPILHQGRFVGRLDPKFHRQAIKLEIKSIYLEEGFRRNKSFEKALQAQIESLAEFMGTSELQLPKGWHV